MTREGLRMPEGEARIQTGEIINKDVRNEEEQ